MKFATKVIHAGIEPDPSTGAIMTPIFQTSTYVQEGISKHKGYEYSRTQNPTRMAFEKNIAALENGKYGLAYASGMSAIDSIIKLLSPGDEVISTSDLYGGSYRMFKTVFEQYGLKFHFNSMQNLDEVKKLINEKTRLIWIETPTNPTLKVIDIKAIADLAHENNAWLGVDNTFATPFLQRPLDMSADIIMHSVTKYLGGHSDLIMGANIVNDDGIAERLYHLQNACGAIAGPMDCFLAIRGIKTLHLRMERHCINAMEVARFLQQHAKVEVVNYPGLENHPGHDIATKQMKHYGGMLSFTLKGDDLEMAKKVAQGTKVFSLAESLGGVESLIGHPATMTHAAIPDIERQATGVLDSLLRLSVGIEDIQDLIEDLDKALA